ncbi:type I restriction endonuclease subunit R [Arthrospira platensis]|uniref:type I restriction endonuclease subunit R n=1 Tax=Limnospira TaxID=2596745 RepID=UPI0016863582|nr:HsdR family type I site-specific deoxyribonuclease [Arthrospira platensis]MBD2573939.1 HsdR family type I site-specific deoxyribonuclease [Arthrospira platensis FACHB-971]MBD2670060.1 HsdR family type I site-specific deoxyribonuclease [Arthrospira platensis FACHB-439]MBD2710587.1 HsdR family type I site-specific deoxyribonuclease [Arthrospira platensis FACHB-835]MDT9182632.1 HsdR family type I site-specific deoxyribonuclease [Limnospira sp. PMC 289.06]
MIKVGQVERVTQNRVIKLFQNQLGYTYLGNWKDRENNGNIEAEYLTQWLTQQGIKDTLINKTLRELDKAASLGETQNLYDANKAVYRLLRYGVKVKGGAGEQTQTVWLIDWENPDNNRFYLAEEVTIKGNQKKRPDIVVYINGIAVAVLELKRSTVSVAEGIRQNLDNQKKEFIRPFFTTLQLVMAGNDTQGLRYGTIETSEKYYLEWKEAGVNAFESLLDWHLSLLCEKSRLLEIIHDFIIFDAGIKKTCRHNQYFGIKVAQEFIDRREGGIIWHTQGSGKSLTMVWLAKWIREHQRQARVLIISDRTELDEQISSIFKGVDEEIYRTESSADLMNKLNQTQPWLMCSLIHKFGHSSQEATEEFINSLQQLPSNFSPKGNLFVFVDECHRTQSGKLHTAMKQMLPNALFIGFTGTPLLKQDKQRSIEVFGGYIHTYKFNEAVRDGVILDLRYEARDIDQTLTSPQKIDQWFEAKTRGLSEFAKTQLKKKWGTMQKLLSSKSRLEQIVNDILLDMETKPRLMDGRGNAMLVCSSIYQACKTYEILSQTDFKGKCAIITSYKPSPADIKGEETGEGLTEKLHQYGIYRRMLADYFNQPEDEAMYRVGEFEQEVKRRFIDEPGQMRLLIVVDKLLTGFDAPPATYLYIDKTMRDHGLFQAICRVNRLDGEDKEYGYIVDYKDLFQQLEGAVTDYTSGAFEDYEAADVAGLLSDRLSKGQERLETALEAVRALCETVPRPRHTSDYLHYFCAADTTDKTALAANEAQRVALYQTVNAAIRAYSNLANEMEAAGYTPQEAASIKEEVSQYSKMRDEVKIASGDYIDSKIYEPAMRYLMDTYIRAEPSNLVADFEELGLVQLMVNQGLKALDSLPEGLKDEEAMAETIENNIRKIILDESPINPKYYEEMSELLDALIAQRHQQAISYQEYLEQVKQLARQVIDPTGSAVRNYPPCLNTPALRSLYDNLGKNEAIALAIDGVVKTTKKDGWIGNRFKEREVKNAVDSVLSNAKLDPDLDQLLELIKQQHDYQ